MCYGHRGDQLEKKRTGDVGQRDALDQSEECREDK